MQIVVHDNKMRKVALINNNYPDMLSFNSDSWHRYLPQATSTFDFTIPKLYNGRLHEDLGFINDKAYFSFKFQGKHHLFYVANITEDDFNITLNCNNTNLELVNEQANPFTSNSAQNIAWYLQHMELLTFATLEIGVNEIADKTRTLTFESQETKLARLQSLMSRFNAEFEFVTELNNNGTLKRIVLNIYHEADSEHHGIGKVRGDVVLRYGNDVKGVQVTTDKTQLFNTGVFTGADGLTLKDVERSDKDANGNEEFYTRKGNLAVYAPLSMERYPASMKEGDNWTRKDFQTEYTNVNDLLAYAFRTIKQYAYPIVSYTASIQSNFLNDYQDLVLGDTVKIYDKNFVGGLILQARVTEQVISFSNPNNNTLTFSNYVKLASKISDTLRNRMAEMIEARLPYTLKMSTSAGTSFKNGTGESIVTPELYKGQKKITDATYRYYFGSEMTTGQTYKVLASKIENKQVLTVAAYVGNDEAARDKLTFINVSDGKNGVKGDKGDRGEKGEKGDTGARGPQGERGLQGPSGQNLLRNSAGPFKPGKKPSDYDNCEYYPKSTVDMVNGKQYILTAETDGVITSNHDGGNASDNVVIWLASLDYNIHSIISDGKTDKSGTVFTWAYPTGTYMLRVNTYKKVSDKSVWKIKIAEGNTKTGWSPAFEDVEDNINSKADQSLTQEQLNALNEKNSIMQAELEAKASLDTVNQWFKAYQDFVNSNAADKAKAEKDLIAATQRVAKIENNLGDMAQRWNFIDTYMQATNEGLSIGKKDGSSFVRMGDNRISFYSAGKEVAYFSGGALQVDNGVFTKTLQIGRFREEQYHLNPDMNVIRYVGGA